MKIEFGRIYIESLKGKDSDGRFVVVQLGRLVLQLSVAAEAK